MEKSSDDTITDGLKIISYIANGEGNQELVSGSMWQPVNIVNRQAWQEIEKQVEASKAKVAAGKVSCLHYYMTANQMDIGLLARYTGQSRWCVMLHLLPPVFRRLRGTTLNKYAEIFKVSKSDLIKGRLGAPVYSQKGFDVLPDDKF